MVASRVLFDKAGFGFACSHPPSSHLVQPAPDADSLTAYPPLLEWRKDQHPLAKFQLESRGDEVPTMSEAGDLAHHRSRR